MESMIFGLIGQAMKKIGAIGKDSENAQQKYKFRGIDAVYNALNPVMSELGLFICPEILDHRREERISEKTYNGQTTQTVLKYSILTIKYTVYAPDGSSVSCVVVGEGMDSGDKASNKAMSVALKYACFQLFMIPTEEMVDPDAETHEVTSGARIPAAPRITKQETLNKAQNATQNTPVPARVEKIPSVPQTAQEPPKNPVLEYMKRERENLRAARGISKEENGVIWAKQVEALIKAGMIPNKDRAEYTQQEAENMIACMYSNFPPTGTELKKNDGKSA